MYNGSLKLRRKLNLFVNSDTKIMINKNETWRKNEALFKGSPLPNSDIVKVIV